MSMHMSGTAYLNLPLQAWFTTCSIMSMWQGAMQRHGTCLAFSVVLSRGVHVE